VKGDEGGVKGVENKTAHDLLLQRSILVYLGKRIWEIEIVFS